jgi:membrane protein
MLRRSLDEFFEDGCPTMAAALAYYAVFSFPPLLILTLMLVRVLWDPQSIQEALQGQFAQLVGGDAARQIGTMMSRATAPGGGGAVTTVLGVAALFFGVTGAFVQLQGALNRAWEVEPDPAQGGVRNFIVKRLFTFAMALAVAFLLLVSLLVSAALTAFGGVLQRLLPGVGQLLLMGINAGVSFVVITLLFAAMFRVIPDAVIAWRDVWAGAVATALLFVAGKFAIGYYLGRSDPGEAFGAAGSLAVLLLWIYYSGLILLFGAEFTQAWTEGHGREICPEEGAVRVEREKRRVRG